eukprot:365203-Chlamydomonas_euryale.AAC.6
MLSCIAMGVQQCCLVLRWVCSNAVLFCDGCGAECFIAYEYAGMLSRVLVSNKEAVMRTGVQQSCIECGSAALSMLPCKEGHGAMPGTARGSCGAQLQRPQCAYA